MKIVLTSSNPVAAKSTLHPCAVLIAAPPPPRSRSAELGCAELGCAASCRSARFGVARGRSGCVGPSREASHAAVAATTSSSHLRSVRGMAATRAR
eukprot:scaffold14265_cov58-Phaeocystis_antarctica.AAC.5